MRLQYKSACTYYFGLLNDTYEPHMYCYGYDPRDIIFVIKM